MASESRAPTALQYSDHPLSIYARRIGEELDALRRRADEVGVETFYWDDQGNYHDANPESLRRVVDVVDADRASAAAVGRRLPPLIVGSGGRLPVGVEIDFAELTLDDGTSFDLAVVDGNVETADPLPIGCHTLRLDGRGVSEMSTIVVAPDRMPASSDLAGGVAVFAPAYALWEADAPLPSYRHLAALGHALPDLGVNTLITLPLYAPFLDEPFDPSPYAPISRLHWNEVFLDDTGLPPAPIPEIGHLIDWRELGVRRRTQLLTAARDVDGELAARVHSFVAANPDVADYARFQAKVAVDQTDAGHPTDVVELSHQLAQLLAHEQLSELRGCGAAIALDLPIGSHPMGYESWAYPELFAEGMGVGAPPDSMFPSGQNWGFVPQLPASAEQSGFELWRRIIRRCGQYASMLRIDHVLGVHRLWWIPEDMTPSEGVYVRYPRQALLSVIAAEASVAGTTVVGEDLGTVPQEIIDAMAEWSMLGLYAEQAVLPGHRPDPGINEHDLPAIPARMVAGLRTHDMEPFAALYERGELTLYRSALARALGRRVGTTAHSILSAALGRLAASEAYLVFADLDDLLGETTPHNIPGKVLPTIWRRRLRQPTSATLARRDVRRHLGTLAQRVQR